MIDFIVIIYTSLDESSLDGSVKKIRISRTIHDRIATV